MLETTPEHWSNALASLLVRKVLGCVCVAGEEEKDEEDEILSYHSEKPDEKGKVFF